MGFWRSLFGDSPTPKDYSIPDVGEDLKKQEDVRERTYKVRKQELNKLQDEIKEAKAVLEQTIWQEMRKTEEFTRQRKALQRDIEKFDTDIEALKYEKLELATEVADRKTELANVQLEQAALALNNV